MSEDLWVYDPDIEQLGEAQDQYEAYEATPWSVEVCSLTPIPRQTSLIDFPLASSTSAFRRWLMIWAGVALFGAAMLTSLSWFGPATI